MAPRNDSSTPTMSPSVDATSSVSEDGVSASRHTKNGSPPPSSSKEDEEEETGCEQLYGPYPDAAPRPWRNSRDEGRDGDADADAAVDFRDANSPDAWLPRDGRLVRLTGRHPFNVEPPLQLLKQHGFLTPPSLHYVRNHGACPRLEWETHTVAVGRGDSHDTDSAVVYTMDQIAALQPARELPVTLVCAGNRRKEQNMLRQTIGFNWGCAGVSTNVYRGVLLRDLLLHAGVVTDVPATWRGRHVEFLGAEDLPNKVGPGPFPDQPWGKLVKYGTSIPLARAMNPAYDVLIAYEANGAQLQPDHGYPVRLVVPGYIGGRMIKWLAAINVIDHETKNHYHYHDNRILPPQITAEESLKGGWWYQPSYIFNELNINSAVAAPDHNETLDIAAHVGQAYEMKGYAYSGGGRKVTRVEVSTDGGAHWELATVHRRERPTEYGMHWCWVWWTFNVPVADLVGCTELVCRAWDESNNVQPMNPTWNLMGMGNNQVFRVKVHCDRDAANDRHVFRFEHPTQPGQQTGGWMTRVATKPDSAGFGRLLEQGDAAAAPAVAAGAPAAPKTTGKLFTLQEVKQHSAEDDCWIIVKDRVYDATEYLELHPGGIESITMNGGMDATEDFVAIHSTKATKMLEKYYIGDLDKTSVDKVVEEEPELVDERGRRLALHPRKKVSFRLQNKIVLSRDSFLLDFALPTPEHVLGLPTGKHVFMSATIDGETVLRRYTPISSNHDVGCIKFVIKCYRPCERFPDGGKMTQYIDTLSIGDYLDFKGPVGEFEYLRDGKFLLEGEGECRARCYNMLAGGTGITPVMQIAAEILRHPRDATRMSLIFACRVEGDLLMRSTLDEWAARFPDRFRVHYILSDGWPSDWKYSTGFVDKPLFEEHLYPAADDVYNLMCGPPIMLQKGCAPNLEALGHPKSHIFSF